jgi:heme oxygenase
MLTTRLKDDNWALHQIAERQETPGSLIKGTMPKDGYIAMLSQQLLINRALDHAMQHAIEHDARINELVLGEQKLSAYLEADLAFFGINPGDITPTPGTSRFIEHIESMKNSPLHLLGLHYVRLGACNGNRFVARVVRKAYDLEQRTKWMDFKHALDALPFDESEQDAVFEGTRAAYLYTINMDLPEHLSAEQLLAKHGKTLDKQAFEDGHSVHVATPS